MLKYYDGVMLNENHISAVIAAPFCTTYQEGFRLAFYINADVYHGKTVFKSEAECIAKIKELFSE